MLFVFVSSLSPVVKHHQSVEIIDEILAKPDVVCYHCLSLFILTYASSLRSGKSCHLCKNEKNISVARQTNGD